MKNRLEWLALIFAVSSLQLIGGCASQPATPAMPANEPAATAAPQTTAPQTPLQQLIAGNERYATGHLLHPRLDEDRRTEVAQGQHPIAIVVGCSDSRVPPEIVFDQGLGDIFVVRLAGNVVDDLALGSIEYAVEHLHAHLIVVLGHDKCGAVQAAVTGGDAPGHIGSILHAIAPAVEKARHETGDLLDNAVNENVLRVVNQIKTSAPILAHEVETNQLTVVGARYKLAPGAVQWLSQP
jgi:carbonic anhydrase